MSTSFLTTSVFDTDVYSTSYGKILSEYMAPVCPATTQGGAQVYNTETSQCTPVAAANVMRSVDTAAACGGEPFRVQMSNTCYSTNECATSNSISTACLNSQLVPVERPAPMGPGVIYNAMPTNYWWV